MLKYFGITLLSLWVLTLIPGKQEHLYYDNDLPKINDHAVVPANSILIPGNRKTLNTTVTYNADIHEGTIGIPQQQHADNAYDNIFHINIHQLEVGQEAFLKYELFGVLDHTSIARSINDAQAIGGRFIKLSDHWSVQKEHISLSGLKEGDNVVRFSLPAEAGFYYKVRNVSIVMEDRPGMDAAICINQVNNSCYNNEAYIKGIIEEPVGYAGQDFPVQLYCNGNAVQVCHGEFETVIQKPNNVSTVFDVILKAILADGSTITKKLTIAGNGKADQVYVPTEKNIKIEGSYQSAKGLFLRGIDKTFASVNILPDALAGNTTISVTALRDIDLPPLNTDLVNITKGANGFRFLPHGSKFNCAVDVNIPYDSTLIPEGYTAADIRTYYFDENTREWSALQADSMISEPGILHSYTTHFTDMINGIIKVPESPQTQAYTPTSIKDIKAANASLGIDLINPPVANSMGNASLGFNFNIPKGRQGMQPNIGLQYNNEGGNGLLGLGWNMSIPTIGIDARWGAPRYDAVDETETYSMGGEQLAPFVHRGALVHRNADDKKQFYPRIEGSFNKIIRHKSDPKHYWWEVTNKNGTTNYYGGTPSTGVIDDAVLKDDNGNIASWALVETRDLNNNFVHYIYKTQPHEGNPGGALGRQLYISDIYYTGFENTDGPYRIQFTRDRQIAGEPERKDIDISGRLGFKMVTADLLRKVRISYNGKLIRSYELNYRQGAFYKTLLESVSELDDTGDIFYTHQFDYFDDVKSQTGYTPFNSSQNWSPPNDNIQGDIVNPIAGFSGEATALTSSKSKNSNYGLAITLGIEDWTIGKYFTVGGSFALGSSSTEGMITLIDINGDGLPDKVFKQNGRLFYRTNLGLPGGHQFGDVRPINGINDFSIGESNSSSAGFQANGSPIASVAIESSNSINRTKVYFSDFNGDGLMDIASGGQVFFNRLDANGDPSFLPTSTGTPSPIDLGNGINSTYLAPDTARQSQQERDYPLQDIIRMWVAPFNGFIAISAPVQLLDLNTPGLNNTKLDGVRASIQIRDSFLWAARIDSGDYTIKTPTDLLNIPVKQNDQLYFRLQSIKNGDEDVVKWDPVVRYNNIISPSLDANNRQTNYYQASKDFILSSRQPSGMHKAGTIKIDGNFSKDITSDTVILKIIKKSGAGFTTLLQNIYSEKTIVNNQPIEILNESVSQGDSLYFVLYADSYIDRAALKWNPHYVYTIISGGIPATNLNGQPTIEEFITPNNSNYNDWYITTSPRTNPVRDTVVVTPLIKGPLSANGTACFTIKGRDTIYGKRIIRLVGGLPVSGTDSIRIDSKPNDTLYYEYHISDRAFALSLSNTKFRIAKHLITTTPGGNPDTTFLPPDTLQAGMYVTPDKEYLGTRFRNWGHFSFKGDPTNGLLDSTKINVDGFGVFSTNPNDYPTPGTLSGMNSASQTEFIPLYPVITRKAWVGFDSSVYVTSTTMGSARLWMHDVSVDSLMSGSAIGAVEKITETNTTSNSFGFAASPFNANRTSSSSETINTLDMMDMNGDRYPDVLYHSPDAPTTDEVQFTLPNGGLEPAGIPNNLGPATFNGESEGYSLGGSLPISLAKNTAPQDAKNTTANAGATIGISGSGSITTNDDNPTSSWMDINGDGLPDKVYPNGNVALNYGYHFGPSEPWNFIDIEKNHSSQTGVGASASGSFGFNDMMGSFQGGFNLLHSDSDCSTSLEDVNGDGLPDKLYNSSGQIRVRLNTGNGFGQLIPWTGLDLRKNTSTGESINAAFNINIPIYLIVVVLKLCINPSASFGNGVSRESIQLSDIDGDGFPDVLHSQNDGNLTAERSTIGRTNMLRTVKRPMNGSFTLDYERTGNTYALPQNKWVLKTVEISDGVAGDGVDTMRNSFTYENGYYDRDAREFYGFAKVTSSQLNTAANDVVYRSNVQQFLNNEYYTKGLVEKEWVEDASGKKYTETTNEYRKVNVEDSVKFPSLIQTNKLFYEGNPTPGITTSTQFDYDAFGNIIQIKDNGDGSIQDMIIADITYHNPPGIYPKNSPKSIVVNTTEGIKRKRETLLDNNGNLIQIKQYLADGTAAVHDIAYDDYGNMTKITRPLNDSGKRLWYHYEYDNAVHTYITKIDDAYGYSSSSTYDYSFGGLTGTMSENDEPMRYELDNRGRLITITGPYELAAGKPYTIAFDYHPDANVPYAISHHYDPEYDSDINTVTFMDGLGRAIQVKKDISLFADSAVADQLKMSVSGKDIYDAFGRVIQNHHPVTEPIGSSNTILNTTIGVLLSDMDLDVLNRNTNTTLADGATSTKTYSIANGFFNTSTKDPLQNIKEEQTDVRERKRIINLMSGPNGTITTKFNYNALSELISVIDAGGNAIINEYDNLGRKISVKHPDAGLTEFSYDLAGNLLKKVTPQIRKEIPNGGAIEYRYEFERLTDIDYPRQYQNKVKYVYGAPGTGSKAGRLILQQDASGGQEFYYGKLGEVVKTIRTLLASDIFYTTYVSEQEYDTWNRVKKMVYPDGEVVKYHYNKAGSLYSIDGSKDGNNYQYVTQLGYDEYEQRVYLLYGNGAENKYQYDPVRRRLSNLFAETGSGRSFMNNTYSYDPVSNIKSIENNVQAVPGTLGGYAKQDFGYDNLYRLTSAAGQFKGAGDLSSYNLSMSYDNLYNITHKKIFGTPGVTSYDFAYSYAGNAPHQPDKVGTVQYKYDLNGNQVNSGNSQFFWDEENRLMAVIADGVLSRYTYDATGDRAIKSSGGIRGMWVNGAPAGLINHDTNYTAYVSPYVVCRRTGFTKHIYIESQRIATKIGIGKFRNISFGQQQSALTAGSIDYLQRFADMQRQRYAYYASLGISPGPPTDKYFYALPYNNGIAAPIFIDTSHSSVPIGWPGNTTPPILGPPIFVNPIPSNDSVKAGYGFESTGHFYEQSQYFYHPDHLGSTSYVTNIFGEVCQHQEYSAFGETFLEEHASSYTTPYLYNAKERDAETGLYYYGARYYNPVSSIWLSVDPEFDKNPGFSPYNYCLQNPVILNDPNGKSPDWGAVGKGFVKGVVVGAVGAAIVGGAIVAGTAMIAVGGAVAVAGAVVAGAGYGVAIYGAYQTGKATGEALITGTDTYSGRSLSNSERSEMGGEILGGIVGGLGAAKGMKAAMAQNSNLAGKALSLNKSVADVMGESYKAAGEKTASIKNEGLKNKLNAISKGDWVKVYEAGIKDGNKVETHYFRNNSTGEVFDVKPKYDYWHQRSFKSLE